MIITPTKQEKINELKQNFSNPINARKVIVLVEGEDDCRLFKKLFNTTTCIIDFIPGGKFAMQEGLTALLQIHRRSIAIQDADFAHLEGIENTNANLFLTDFHDMEMLMISQQEIYNGLLHEFAPHIEKEKHIDFFNKKLSELRFTSYLRFVNHKNNWQFNFKGISFGKVFDNQSITIDNNKILDLVLSRSPDAVEKNKNNVENIILEVESSDHDILQLCNGHDVTKIVGLFLGISDKSVSQKVRINYRISDFEKSKLYQNILLWANQKNIEIF
jgi:hypothetical protein